LPTLKSVVLRILLVLAALGLSVVACQGPEAFYRDTAGGGGSFGTGGAGLVGSGGATGTGGTIVTSTGGTTGTGGTPATGGTTGTGGTRATGGTTGTGGTRATGGTTGTGGTPATGGTTGTGGTRATGGTTGTGGVPATGGATGTGGSAAGTGGASATGGATGTGGTPGAVAVDTYCQSAASAQSISLYAEVLNTSSTAIPLSSITFRYYFQVAETSDPPHLDIDYSQTVPVGDITSSFMAITPAVTGANEYMEVGFTTAAGSLAAQSNSGQIQLRLHATNYANPFDSNQTTDYSFQTCATGQTANSAPFHQQTTITAYVGGVLSSGVEPP
jgi:Cellulose binding domain